jgi:DNA-binding NarL/FixJ family response regulator
MGNIRVAIIEDQEQTRNMLTSLMGLYEEYDCVGAFESAENAIKHIPELEPDVVLVDIHLPGLSGTQCVAKLKGSYPKMQFVMCTSLEDTETIFAALQAGATGYITKSTTSQKIIEAIHDAYHGGSPMSSQIARKVISFFHHTTEKVNKELDKLSTREQEILEHLSKGYRYKEIAGLLFINIETVRKHIHNIYEKLQVNSRTDALNKVYPKK